MKAINISIDEFISVLTNLKSNNVDMIDLDMIPDENHAKMNKLIIHPIRNTNTPTDYDPRVSPGNNSKIGIINPNFNTDTNEIFDAFEDIL